MNVVGVDLSLTATGIAGADGHVSVFTTDARTPFLDRLRAIRHHIVTQVLHVDPAVVAVEDLPQARAHTIGKIGMLHGVVRLALDDMVNEHVLAGVVCIPPASRAKYATGKGNASKSAVLVAAVSRLGYDGYDDNEADALWLRAMTLDHYGEPVVEVPAVNRAALERIDWPVVAHADPHLTHPGVEQIVWVLEEK